MPANASVEPDPHELVLTADPSCTLRAWDLHSFAYLQTFHVPDDAMELCDTKLSALVIPDMAEPRLLVAAGPLHRFESASKLKGAAWRDEPLVGERAHVTRA